MNRLLITVLFPTIFFVPLSNLIGAEENNIDHSCQIDPYPYYFSDGDLEKSMNSNFYISQKNCTKNSLRLFYQKILGLHGEIPSKYFHQNTKINVLKNKISIININKFLEHKLKTPAHLSFDSFKLTPHSIIGLNELGDIEVVCEQCHSPGNTNIKMITPQKNERYSTYYLNGNILEKIKTLKVSQKKESTTSIDDVYLSTETIKTLHPEQYWTTLENNEFYYFIRKPPTGTIIKKSMLAKKTLVKAYSPTKVYFSESGLMIQTSGLSLKNGSFGEIIPVKNTKTNKTYLATVTGNNKVEAKI